MTKTSTPLIDKRGRRVRYLRLSITDRCNLRCQYCWPGANMKFIPHDNIIRYEEIFRLVRVAHSLDIDKVRLTGGEPFVRKNFLYLVDNLLAENPGLDLRITTNATLLAGKEKALAKSGVRRLNISLDTLNREKYIKVAGRDFLPSVLDGIHGCLDEGIRVKINAVAQRGVNDDELHAFVQLAKELPIDIRFIELMPIGCKATWNREHFWSARDILAQAGEMADLTQVEAETTAGPAKLFEIGGGKGRIGVITPMSDHFCLRCNRLRITADGRLKTCLYAKKSFNLLPTLRSDKLGDEALRKTLRTALGDKPLGYELLEGAASVGGRAMNAIGG